MSSRTVQIIDTGVANIRSLQVAFERLNCRQELVTDAQSIESADYVVLPGVGSFGAGMKALKELGLNSAIKDRVQNDAPTLAICLGLQLLCRGSQESPGIDGLAVIDSLVTRFSDNVQIPQLGWNLVSPIVGGLIEPGMAYFANSFRLCEVPLGWNVANTNYGGEFVSALWKGNILACQFHPELSGSWGESLIRSWMKEGSC